LLKVVNKHIADLETDLSDGLRLIALVEVLSGKLFQQKYTRRPTLRPQKLENVTMALRFLERDEGIRIVNIGEYVAGLAIIMSARHGVTRTRLLLLLFYTPGSKDPRG